MSTPDDDDEPKREWIHPGDLGTILLAAVFLVGMLFMMFGPSPFDKIFKNKPAPQAQASQSNVVDVTVPPKD